jgi:hypothetical protein
VVEAMCGGGYVLPLMVIISGVIHHEWCFTATNIDDDTLLAVSKLATQMIY